jgi:2-isopropylmalate synthase
MDSRVSTSSHSMASAKQPWWNPQRSSPMPYQRYWTFGERVRIPRIDRSWPDQKISAAPLWVPVDLRDGNQALAEPMDLGRKYDLFSLLVKIGFKEIEIGYPSASQADFNFTRHLAEDPSVPDDVTISVFTPARAELIDRTFEAMAGITQVLRCDLQPDKSGKPDEGPRHLCLVEGNTDGLIRWGAGVGDSPAEAVLRAIVSSRARCK